MFTHMLARKGIARFGKRSVAAIVKEYKLLDQGAFPGKTVFQPISKADTKKEESGEDISSPTVSLEAMTSTLLIDTYEERDVAIFDVS